MAELPQGTVTFLFTDIEGSTRLVRQPGDAYAGVLVEHERLLRAAFDAHGGREIDTQGDAFFVAFPRAKDAVAAVVTPSARWRSTNGQRAATRAVGRLRAGGVRSSGGTSLRRFVRGRPAGGGR